MWTRKELKDRAKASLKRNYWKSVLVGFIVSLIYAGTATNGKNSVDDGTLTNLFSGMSSEEILISLVLLGSAVLTACLISAVFRAIVYNPLRIGISEFCIEAINGTAKFRSIANGYKTRTISKIWTLFLRDFYVVLWGILFIVPGIVKAYEYSQLTYILADNPDISTKDALRQSKALMKGNKWKAFVLDLSFLGWDILSILTFGILGVFYVEPYKLLTDAALYEKLKQNAEIEK